MKIIEAGKIDVTSSGMTQQSFSHAIVQKSTPGTYLYRFGEGKMAAEAVTNFMMSETTTVAQVTKNIDALAKNLGDETVTKKVFQNIFPTLTQQLAPNSVVMSALDVQSALQKGLPPKTPMSVIASYGEILIEALAETSFVMTGTGYQFREERTNRYPTYEDLARDFWRSEIIDVLQSIRIRVNIKENRFTPAYLLQRVQERFTELARSLRGIGYNYQHLQDALYCAYSVLTAKGSITKVIPKEIRDSTELNDLMSNITFVQAAFTAAPASPMGGEWNLKTAVASTLRVLNMSARYQVMNLKTAMAHYRYTQVLDPRSNLVGGVLSYAVKMRNPIEIGLFDKLATTQDIHQISPLPLYSNAIASLSNPLEGWDVMGVSHNAVQQIVSSLYMSEFEDAPKSRLFVLATLSELDLIHMAAAHADAVYLPNATNSAKGSRDASLVFKRDLRGLRLYADSTPFEGVIYTDDPATLLMSLNTFDAEIPFDLSTQLVPPQFWEALFVGDIDSVRWDYNHRREIKVDVVDTKVSTVVSINDMVKLYPRTAASMVRNPFTAEIFTKALSAPLEALDFAKKEIAAKGLDKSAESILSSQVGYMLNAMLEKLYGSDAMRAVTEDVLRTLVRKTSPKSRELTYSRLHQAHYRRQLQVALCFVVLQSLGYLEMDQASLEPVEVEDEKLHGQSSIEKRVTEFLDETKFYDRIIGTEIAKDFM